MYTVDELEMDAPVAECFQAGADVEGWPDALPHYRWVRFQRRDAFGTGRVEMAARRHFGPIPYPVWWVSEMTVDRDAPAVLYRHVDGITTGMDVVWSFEPVGEGRTLVRIVHDWKGGPAWPLPHFVRRLIADLVIGPVFIRHVASRTLKGIRDKAERIYAESRRVKS
jgi:ribosome-associated toxin RatA of RatAB toxin-antitoxin module